MLNERQLTYWDDRLENWARWLLAGGGGASIVSSIYSFSTHGNRDNDIITIIIGDAVNTHELIGMLEDHLRRAVVAWYLETGTDGQKAFRLGIHRDTLPDRVANAKVRLAQLQQVQRARCARKQNTSVASGK